MLVYETSSTEVRSLGQVTFNPLGWKGYSLVRAIKGMSSLGFNFLPRVGLTMGEVHCILFFRTTKNQISAIG